MPLVGRPFLPAAGVSDWVLDTGFAAGVSAPEQMAAFCAAAFALPTRDDVPVPAWPVRQAEMARYTAQSADIRPELVEQVTVPAATAVNLALVDELDRAFLGDDPDEVVAADLVGAVDRAVRRLSTREAP